MEHSLQKKSRTSEYREYLIKLIEAMRGKPFTEEEKNDPNFSDKLVIPSSGRDADIKKLIELHTKEIKND